MLSQVVDILADPAKALIIVSSKSFEDSTLPIHEKWYKFNYSLEKMSEERINELRAPNVVDNGKLLDLPPQNNLIATNFDVLAEEQSLSARPQLLSKFDGVADLWYLKDDKFKKPKAIVSCKIYTADLGFGTSPEAAVFAEVWRRVLSETLREFTYMADCAKLDFSASIVRDNIQVQWKGFNDALGNFVSETLQRISAFKQADCAEIFA